MTDQPPSQPFDLAPFAGQLNPHVEALDAAAYPPRACCAATVTNSLKDRIETVKLWLEPTADPGNPVLVHIHATLCPNKAPVYMRDVFVPIGANWGPLAQEFLHAQTVATIATLIAGWEARYSTTQQPAPAVSLDFYTPAERAELRRLLTAGLPYLTGKGSHQDLVLMDGITAFMECHMRPELTWLSMCMSGASGVDLSALGSPDSKLLAEAVASIRAFLSVH